MNITPNVYAAAKHERKAYATPTLHALGSVSDLVMSGNSAGTENAPSPSKMAAVM